MDERRRDPPARAAFLGSVALHVAAIVAVTLGATRADSRPPQVRVYRVDIVSPAPNVLGEPPAEPPAPAEPAAAAAPEAAPPAPTPVEPAPEPDPAPPRETPKAPERPRTPEARPERPKAPQPETPRRPAPERETARTPASQPKNREPAERTGSGESPTRSAGTGTRPGQATGRNPDPRSPGGEGLNVRTQGVACPENYCNNVVRQVRRFFRAPEGTQGASGNVCFTLFRDGSVDEVTVERQRGGGFQFRLALVEAVEQAGLQRAFGALPRGFESESIQLCVLMSPATT